MAAKSLASQVGVTGVPGAGRATGDLLPSSQVLSRAPAAPFHARPGPVRGERERVLETLCSPRFVDRSPAEVVATLLDEGQYLCSERTMYRILAASQPMRERRNQLTHPATPSPSWSRPDRTKRGRGTSPAFWDRNAGRTFTCTCCSTSSADTWSGGWSRNARARRWPHGSSSKPTSSRASSPDADPAFGSRGTDDQQMHRAAASRPRGDPLAQPSPGQ